MSRENPGPPGGRQPRGTGDKNAGALSHEGLLAASLNPDFTEAARFLTMLDEEAERFLFCTFDDVKGRADRALTQAFFGPLAQHQKALSDLNRRGAGVFVTINETAGPSRKRQDITRLRALWRDNDTGDPRQLPIEPNVTVETSPGRSQDLILIDGAPLDCDAWERVQARIVEEYGSDPNAKDRSRVLKLPGFFHMKNPTAPHLVRIVHAELCQHSRWTDVVKALPPVDQGAQPEKDTGSQSRPVTPELLAEVASALLLIDPNPYFEWVRCAMWLHELGDVGFEIWLVWSRKAAGQDITCEAARKKWNETNPDSTGLGCFCLVHPASAYHAYPLVAH